MSGLATASAATGYAVIGAAAGRLADAWVRRAARREARREATAGRAVRLAAAGVLAGGAPGVEEEPPPGWLDVPLDEHLRRGRRSAVPALAALGCLALGVRYGWAWPAVPFLYFVPLLAALAVVDLHTHRLPNALTLPSYPAGLLLVGGAALAHGTPAVLGTALAAALLLSAVFLVLALWRPNGMGMGDVKAAGVVGLFAGALGVGAAIVAVFLGALLAFAGGAVLIAAGRITRRTPTPFGPWLATGSLVAVLAGPALFGGYLALIS